MKKVIPIFFATDDNYAPFLVVCLKSLLANCSKEYDYKFYVLTTNLAQKYQDDLKAVVGDSATIEFVSLKNELDKLQGMFHLRDYYSKETYYRFFIPDLFPQYEKVLYLDCDTIILGDIAELYNTDISDYYVAAAPEEVMATIKVFGDYVEKALGVPVEEYFNAGILLINTKKFRKNQIAEKFVDLLKHFTFRVTQDEDYLNVLCKGHSKILDLGWNKTAYKNPDFDDKNLKIIHYKINWKPWHYENTLYEEYFWDFAKQTQYYDMLMKMRDEYSDERKQADYDAYISLEQKAIEDTNNPNFYDKNYLNDDSKEFFLVRYIKKMNKIKEIRKLIGIRK
ncbi:MAG: glycosyltransferase family 8 protein [Treponema sp.]|nr:glycosyltransferase family 8 protein [Treponema sp.]